jgi:hypothetical protein
MLRRLRTNGIVHPYWTYREAHAQRLGLPVGCAMLMEETGGGTMEFGHDIDARGPCPGYGWGLVTKAKYLAFRHLRDVEGRSNGVGATQLTSPGLQNEADALGGCWTPRWNIAVGFRYLAGSIREYGLERGIAAYNGSGPAALAYAQRVIALAEHFKSRGCGTVIGVY